ncbi:MAG: helix-turn-helix domain-containing protein [Candidatus Woesearchaeota archaeon]|nr:helix-turn-helix domain-containing protein [Candidatus Woesearchaeota archaeon]
MIVQKNFLNKLKDFGLNSYEAKLWTALLSRGVSTAGELSDIAGVPRSRSYDVLESLEKKGFIIMKVGKPIKYLAVKPEEVVERVKKRIREDAQKEEEIVDEIKKTNTLVELNLLHKQGIELVDPTDLSGSIRGRDNIYNHLDFMIKNAEKSVVIVTTADGLVRKAKELRKTLEKAKERGVKIKIASPSGKESQEVYKNLKGIAEFKHINDPQARFAIVDGKSLLFMLMDDKSIHPSYDVGVWVETPYFASAFESFFNNSWQKLDAAEKVLNK